jgi:hypothetical protein
MRNLKIVVFLGLIMGLILNSCEPPTRKQCMKWEKRECIEWKILE